MNPDLEVVAIGSGESFKAWEHGYPYRTVRWHFHPEYEIHHVVATTGQYFVGDFIGEFEPGNLVLTGPNLPHNWVSDVPVGVTLPLRCRVRILLCRCEQGLPGTVRLRRHIGNEPPWCALHHRDRRNRRPNPW